MRGLSDVRRRERSSVRQTERSGPVALRPSRSHRPPRDKHRPHRFASTAPIVHCMHSASTRERQVAIPLRNEHRRAFQSNCSAMGPGVHVPGPLG